MRLECSRMLKKVVHRYIKGEKRHFVVKKNHQLVNNWVRENLSGGGHQVWAHELCQGCLEPCKES